MLFGKVLTEYFRSEFRISENFVISILSDEISHDQFSQGSSFLHFKEKTLKLHNKDPMAKTMLSPTGKSLKNSVRDFENFSISQISQRFLQISFEIFRLIRKHIDFSRTTSFERLGGRVLLKTLEILH